jgi:hypothetical protein
MVGLIGLSRGGFVLAVLLILTGVFTSAGPANAVVYCRTVGVPQGCIARAGVVRPGVRRAVVRRPAAVVHRRAVVRRPAAVVRRRAVY